ncbi:MAG: pseudaminic acid cytidylyltransferase [Acidimicrobiia bacterium]|nr:pseudaminic acid cytidylyltransferase [Acidimicrobiia bacterium]
MVTGTSNGATVAVVPARGGSKRIPRKNIRPFRGTPLLVRTINLLRQTSVFDRVVVSTDDTEIAELATAAGAEAPFLRPAELADDHTGARPVIIHAIETLESQSGTQLGSVCIVYPTAVFIEPRDLEESFEQLRSQRVDFVFSAAGFDSPIQRALRVRSDGICELMWPEHTLTRSQDLEEAYHDAGQFYWGHRDSWLAGRPVFQSRSLLHILPRWRVQDIDTEEDWHRAELIHRMLSDE